MGGKGVMGSQGNETTPFPQLWASALVRDFGAGIADLFRISGFASGVYFLRFIRAAR